MAQGIVTVNNANQSQGASPEIERKALFIGLGTEDTGLLMPVNSQSDLSEILGEADSEIKRNVVAAQLNGGENWEAYVYPQDEDYELVDALDSAMGFVSVEFVVVCTPQITSDAILQLQAYTEVLRTSLGRRIFILAATPGILPSQSWASYVAFTTSLVSDVAAYRVACIPLLHGNDIGVLAGRLANRSVSIADSPMRVATGPLLGLGETPADVSGSALTSATLAALDEGRLSVPQVYADYPGVYWGDCNLLDVPGGSYQVIEYLRPVDKAARAIRLLAIAKIADRSLNQTTASLASNQTQFSKPLRDMSTSVVVAGQTIPGDIQPPGDDAVTIVWTSESAVAIYLLIQPYSSPKQIEANIILDLSS